MSIRGFVRLGWLWGELIALCISGLFKGELGIAPRDDHDDLSLDLPALELPAELFQGAPVHALEAFRQLHADRREAIPQGFKGRSEQRMDAERRLVENEGVGRVLLHLEEATARTGLL